MCNKTPKRETEALRDPFDPLNLPPGRDWANAEPTFGYSAQADREWANAEPMFGYSAQANATRRDAIAAALVIGIGKGTMPLDEPLQFHRDPLYDRLSAPPRASRWQQVGLVARTLGKRLCDRHVASCAILAAALIFLALTGVFSLFGG